MNAGRLPRGNYHAVDYVAPAGTWVLEGADGGDVEWKRVFRSLRALQVAVAKMATGDWELKAYRVIGSGADGYTEAVRL